MSKNKQKKVLYLITKSNWGGAQRYVYDLATNLSGTHFDVTVACGGNGLLKQKLGQRGISVITVRSFQRDVHVRKEISVFFELIELYRNERPDIVHLNSSKAGGLGALAARMCGIPRIIFTAHGWPFRERGRNAAWRALALIGSWITALLSHHVICVSEYDLHTARALPFIAQKAVRIYNGIDMCMQFGSGTRIRNAFPDGAAITGTIGELNSNKNHVALIEQARHDPGMYVAIVGEGEARDMLEKHIKKYNLEHRVKLFGFIPASEALRGFDCFALPSRKEGLPYVLLEAKLAGLPIIANRVGGVGEILDAKDLSEFTLEQMLEKTRALYLPALHARQTGHSRA